MNSERNQTIAMAARVADTHGALVVCKTKTEFNTGYWCALPASNLTGTEEQFLTVLPWDYFA